MTNKIFFTFLFVLLFANCFGQFTMDFHRGSSVKGDVQSIITSTLIKYGTGARDTARLIGKITEIYNKERQLIELYHRSYGPFPRMGIDSMPVKTVYIYDGSGNLKESDRYYTTGGLSVKVVYSKKGSTIIAQDYFCPDNRLVNVDTITTDSFGKIIEQNTQFTGVGSSTKRYFNYNSSGWLISEDTYRSDGSAPVRYSYKYNADGDMVEEDYGDGELHTYTYEKYDKMHNWLKRTEYLNKMPRHVVERVIVYY